MLPLSITRNRRAEGQEKAHNNAVRRALERKAVREFIKANPDVLTDEEDLEEDKSGKGADSKQEFYDVCDEKKSDKKGPSAAEKIKIKKSKKKIVSSAD